MADAIVGWGGVPGEAVGGRGGGAEGRGIRGKEGERGSGRRGENRRGMRSLIEEEDVGRCTVESGDGRTSPYGQRCV